MAWHEGEKSVPVADDDGLERNLCAVVIGGR
jgi:hypothetical protein